MELTKNEVSVLKYCLKHGLLTRPKESEMTANIEDIWEQILRKDGLKEDWFKTPSSNCVKSFYL